METAFMLQKGNVKIIALTGIGGAGKTTLARQYAQQRKTPFVWELNAETEDSLIESFSELAAAFAQTASEKQAIAFARQKIGQKENRQKILNYVQNRLKNTEGWILIFDNSTSEIDLKPYLPLDMAGRGKGKIILTSRDVRISNLPRTQSIAVDALTLEEEKQLFTKIMEATPENLDKFLLQLPPFPLDISSAAYYIKDTQISHEDYLKHLRKRDKNFQTIQKEINRFLGEYVLTRQQIIDMTARKIVAQHADFADLLLCVAVLDGQNIPQEFLSRYKKDSIVDLFIHTLKKHSLINHEQNLLRIHRSLQEGLIDFFKREFKNDIQKHTDSIVRCVEKDVNVFIENIDITHIQFFLPHLVSLSKHNELFSEHAQGLINSYMGYMYSYLGDFLKAQPYLEKGLLHLQWPHQNQPDLTIARVLTYLGIISKKLGNYKKSKKLLEESVTLYKKAPSHNSADLAWTLLHLGHLHTEFGKYEKAKNLLEQSMEMYTKQYGATHPKVAWGRIYLADVYRELGDYEKAKNLYEQSWQVYKNVYGPYHSRTASVLMRLGDIYRYLGQYSKSIYAFNRSYNIYNEYFPENYNKIALSSIFLGNIYRVVGCYDLAKPLLMRGVEINEKYYGSDHIQPAWQAVFLGQLYVEIGDYKKAQKLLHHNLKIHAKHFDKTHLNMAWVSHHLANAYKGLGDFKNAQQLYQDSLTIYQRHYGLDHKDCAQILRDFGHLYILKKDFMTAESMLKKAIDIFETNKSPQAYHCYEYLGELYVKQKKWDAARKAYQAATHIVQLSFPKESAHRSRIRKSLQALAISALPEQCP
jgi:tetratricopeptide (TPR) repeat protein